jgi:hypothetical protein
MSVMALVLSLVDIVTVLVDKKETIRIYVKGTKGRLLMVKEE